MAPKKQEEIMYDDNISRLLAYRKYIFDVERVGQFLHMPHVVDENTLVLLSDRHQVPPLQPV